MAEFKTNRMSGSTLLKDVDDGYQDLEDAIVYFFGLQTALSMSGKVFPYTDVDGNISGFFRLAAEPGELAATGPGWRFRDTTNDDEFMLMCVNGYLDVYSNNGTQGSPAWIKRNRMNLATGDWDVGAIEDIGSGCQVFDVNTLVDFGSGAFVEFQYQDFDDADYWSTAAKDRFIIPVEGRYRVAWDISAYAAFDPYKWLMSVYASLYLNGVEIVDSRVGTGAKDYTGIGWTPWSNHGVFHFDALAVDDYIQLGCIVDEGTGPDPNPFLFGGNWSIERIA